MVRWLSSHITTSSPRRGRKNAHSTARARRRPDEGRTPAEEKPIQRRGAEDSGLVLKIFASHWSTRRPGRGRVIACDCVCESSLADEYRSGDTQRAKCGCVRVTSAPEPVASGQIARCKVRSASSGSQRECHVASVHVHSTSPHRSRAQRPY
uniref:Uncharacterized protein n=1 Tax=Trichogramma kaykai TaxID=54128 RepID=A0ABD2X1L5_9HYME